MPGSSNRGRHRLERGLAALRAALDESGAPWMVIGGLAVIARGVRRMTTDVDAVVRGDAVSARDLLRIMKRHDIEPRISNALAFAEENLVLLLRHAPTGVDLDVSFAWSTVELDALRAASWTNFGRLSVPMATASDLVILKALAGRPTDVQDAIALVTMYPDIDLRRAKSVITDMAALAEVPELVAGITEIIARLRALKPPVTATVKKKARRRPRKPR